MDFVKELRAKAKAAGKTIVLCEGEDKRVVEAASLVVKEGIAKIILLGNKTEIEKFGFDMSGVTIVDPTADANADKYAELLYKAREGKINKKTGAPEYADVAAAKAAALKDYTMYGALILKAGDADGFVSGACHSTANTLRPGLQVIKTAPGIKTVSSCFIMVAPEGGNKYLSDGIAVFGDCAINIEPSSEELADIAIASADTAKKIAGIDPKVALLSFSTKGSGSDAKGLNTVGKVVEAVGIAKQKAPELALDGEFQFDAAIAPEVGELKAPGSSVAGHANTFIFPNINAGNIGYKICARMGGWKAIGPVCQGFAKPLNDLSRGCNVDEIVDTVAVTALQA
ncbi:phosphate acetyltransferase [Treponema rectale]|uniref:Phosphate acetyltransferase n=1 Tax=Treponema rectale TaxID=744512 RepID=A0A840SE37_9SPIR|nr:phosphate acetyltransferase [Treponema rectale]MBB5217752.1 phosphate acetyltransferase [Treponema rectale]QOS40520.1 phosphate acetyltransferase [Treponema rectale]